MEIVTFKNDSECGTVFDRETVTFQLGMSDFLAASPLISAAQSCKRYFFSELPPENFHHFRDTTSNFKGVPVLLSWASAARALNYVHDLNSALIAREMVPQISDILAQTQARKVDVFAHSMASLLAMEGLVERERSGGVGRRKNINSIVLAAPDIDIDLFRTQLDQLRPEIRESIFLLVSERDGALRVSSRIAGGVPRVGSTPLEDLEEFGLTIIDLSDIDDSSAGSHSAFSASPDVVQLIGAGMNSVGRFVRCGCSRDISLVDYSFSLSAS